MPKYTFACLWGAVTWTTSIAWTPSMRSSFLGSSATMPTVSLSKKSGWVMYDDTSPEEPANTWSVLTQTEQWISETLSSGVGNPYTRKEVSYACEASKGGPLLLAGLFRRLKDARLLGEQHGEEEENRRLDRPEGYHPHTLRKTEVVVIPSHEAFSESFPAFDRMVEAVNQARRNARDYVTDVSLEKTEDRLHQGDDDDDDDEPRDWSVSVNCAHLHPQYGQLTPEQELQQLKDEPEEEDIHYKEYMEKRQQARRSPYPTVVIEVRSTPPPDFSDAPSPASMNQSLERSSEEAVSYQDIQKLEALFGKSAHTFHPSKDLSEEQEEDAFYRAIGESIEREFASLHKNPLQLSQEFIAQHDPNVQPTAAFTESSTPDVDAGYEFVFTNIAMMAEPDAASSQHYLVMPHFLSSAATSFEKFSMEVTNIVKQLPDASVQVETFHPEHLDQVKRSPFPILKLEWQS